VRWLIEVRPWLHFAFSPGLLPLFLPGPLLSLLGHKLLFSFVQERLLRRFFDREHLVNQ
jgi:hypothetical protein